MLRCQPEGFQRSPGGQGGQGGQRNLLGLDHAPQMHPCTALNTGGCAVVISYQGWKNSEPLQCLVLRNSSPSRNAVGRCSDSELLKASTAWNTTHGLSVSHHFLDVPGGCRVENTQSTSRKPCKLAPCRRHVLRGLAQDNATGHQGSHSQWVGTCVTTW